MITYSDSDIAGRGSPTTRSQTGTIIFLNNVPVSWRSRVQCKTSKSIAQAEIYAVSNTLDDARDLRWRLADMGCVIPERLCVYTDNNPLEPV